MSTDGVPLIQMIKLYISYHSPYDKTAFKHKSFFMIDFFPTNKIKYLNLELIQSAKENIFEILKWNSCLQMWEVKNTLKLTCFNNCSIITLYKWVWLKRQTLCQNFT